MGRWTSLILGSAFLGMAAAGPPPALPHFPNVTIQAAKADGSGNIYMAGYQGSSATADVFVAKVAADGTLIYSSTFGGSGADMATQLDVDASGSVYITGQTKSADFPVTQGALQTTLGASIQEFAIKLDPKGKVQYSTYVGGNSVVQGGAILVNAKGETYISGFGFYAGLPTPDAPLSGTGSTSNFTVKLSADGSQLLAGINGLGGILATDADGNIYIAGAAYGSDPIPVSPGAFQSSHVSTACAGGGMIGIGCNYQFVAKMDGALSQLYYSTFVTGFYGAIPNSIMIDAQNHAIVAGTTNSPDYPATSDGVEPKYIANAPPPPQTCLFGCIFPPPASGYVTELSADGSSLVYSTFISGTQTDQINFAVLTANGIYLSGQASSPDFPNLTGPVQCVPEVVETMLSLDGLSLSAARMVPGNVLAYDSFNDTLLVWTGQDLVSFDPASALPPVACIVDAADLRQVTSVVPGELLSIFTNNILNTSDTAQPTDSYPVMLDGVSASFNGAASPLLYVSPGQTNLQVPFEIAGDSQATLSLASAQSNVSVTRTVGVTANRPAVFLYPATPPGFQASANCARQSASGPFPMAFNSDGSLNSCANPAPAGSTVTLYVQSAGVTSPAQITGAVTASSSQRVNVTIADGGFQQLSGVASAAQGMIAGIWQVSVHAANNTRGAVPITISINSVPTPDVNLNIWFQ